MQGKQHETPDNRPERQLEDPPEDALEPDALTCEPPHDEDSSDSEKTLVLGEPIGESEGEEEEMESEEERVVERDQEPEPSPTPSSRIPIENDDDDDTMPPLEPAASQPESEPTSEISVGTAIDKSPPSPTWNEKFFRTPEYSLKGMADTSDITEMCISLMEFFASNHPHILKTLVLISTARPFDLPCPVFLQNGYHSMFKLGWATTL